jgi:predicted ATPase
MIEHIRFKNFKALKDAELKLGPFNLIVGPNGSGKSTLFQAIQALGKPETLSFGRTLTVGSDKKEITVDLKLNSPVGSTDRISHTWTSTARLPKFFRGETPSQSITDFQIFLKAIRVFALDPSKIAESVPIQPNIELQRNGANLAGVLDHIRNSDEEAFSALRADLARWIPEYDSIIFETPQQGHRSVKLRRTEDKQLIPATDLSEGTLLAICLLTIAYNPTSPPIICLEEPDRALHPRLLRDVRDALYRLSFPEQFGIKRRPVQIIATTHSPYFLDLFKEHPEQIVIAEKQNDGSATFKSLADDEQLREIIGDAPLGEVWYSGVLGGVPVLK